MFFDRPAAKPQSSAPAQPASSRRRNLAALGLAAAMAAPIGLSQFSRLYAEEATGDHLADAPSAAELIRMGREQFEQKKFEQAEKTLGMVKAASLADQQRDAYLSLLTDVKHAATERRAARQELHSGEDAMAADQTLQAISSFREVVDNTFADEPAVKAAREHLASLNKHPVVAEAQAASAAKPTPAPSASGPMTGKQYYDLGISQYRSNDWLHARINLQLAMNSGYKPASLYQDPPAEILKRMTAREQSDIQRVQRLSQAPTTAPADAGAGVTTAPTGDANPNDPLGALRATDDARKIRHDQAVTQSQVWVREAQEAQRANNFDRALDLYTRAAELDPNNAAAVQGRDQMLTLRGQNPVAPNAGAAVAPEIRARKSESDYNVTTNLDQAHAAIQEGHWKDAQLSIDRARLAASADPSIFTPEELQRFTTHIDQTQQDLQRTEEQVSGTAQNAIDKRVREQIDADRIAARKQRQQTIADLIHSSQLLTNQGRYREALQIVDQILILDPINDYAVGVKPLLEDKTQFAEQREYLELKDRMMTQQLNAASEKQIPYDDILKYPVDWPTISQTRDQTVAAERGGTTTDRAVQAQLDRQLPELTFDAVGFSDVVDFLRDVSGTNLFVNWKSLEAAGIDRNTPVTARLRNIKFSKALQIILDSVGGGQTKLGYTVDEGVITISTQDDLSKNVAVRVYDIRDLIINVPDFNDAPQFSLDAQQNQGNQGGGGGGQQGITQGGVTNNLFGGGATTGQQQTGPTREELVESITKLIEDTVATDTWKDNGGSVGALRELQGQLIVTQTPENHRQLVNLLEQLRETRAIQVTIETRFLTVQRNYLQDVGVDLNFLFNLNSSWSKNFGTIPITTPNSTFVMNPTTGVQGSLGGTSETPTGLTTSATYLDDFQVQLTLRAVEASQNSTLVDAPRITLFNGQRAYVLVSTQRAYISNLTPIVSTGVSSFAPTVSVVQSGVLLDVQATVSADRKYVTLTLRPQLATLLDLAPFTFQQGASATSGFGVGNGTTFTPVVAAPSGTIQEPELQITEVKTTVSVPDGGTLLLGGQTVAGMTEREIGVPVLSKIPFLKRLFTNRSMAKDEQILLILVRPTIILQREIEQKQFPLLTSKLSNG